MVEKIWYTHINTVFFIHSSVDGDLGCFYILAVENSTAVNIGVCVSFQISFLQILNLLLIISYHSVQTSAIRKWNWNSTSEHFIKERKLRNAFKVKTKLSWHKSENSTFIFLFHCLKLSLPSGTPLSRTCKHRAVFTTEGHIRCFIGHRKKTSTPLHLFKNKKINLVFTIYLVL